MAFNWARYLELAKQFEAQGSTEPLDEALLRCSMSRAYYAAFCTARNFLIREGHTPPKYEAHYFVHTQFSMSQDNDRKTIGAYLKMMSDRRKRADYDNEYRELVSHIDYQLVLAEEVIDTLSQLRPGT